MELGGYDCAIVSRIRRYGSRKGVNHDDKAFENIYHRI